MISTVRAQKIKIQHRKILKKKSNTVMMNVEIIKVKKKKELKAIKDLGNT